MYMAKTQNNALAALLIASATAFIAATTLMAKALATDTFRVLESQTDGLGALDPEKLVIAYEPVWAIGTGKTASPEQAQEAHAFVRSCLARAFSDADADAIRILYGGSMKASNANDLLSKPDVDGGLIGGASLDVDSFSAIIRAAADFAAGD